MHKECYIEMSKLQKNKERINSVHLFVSIFA